jgi:SAM-dependent methyltransferase
MNERIDSGNQRRINYILKYAAKHAASKKREGLRILDVGCGVGNISFALLSEGYEVTGIDLDADSISFCNKQNSFRNGRFYVADIEKLDSRESFDIIIASEVLEHLLQLELAIVLLNEHLAKGGMLIVTTPNGYNIWEMAICNLAQKMRRNRLGSLIYNKGRWIYMLSTGRKAYVLSLNTAGEGGGHINFFSFTELKGILNRNGFNIVSVEKQGLITSLPPLRQIDRWAMVEDTLAQFLPMQLCGWWGLISIKKF